MGPQNLILTIKAPILWTAMDIGLVTRAGPGGSANGIAMESGKFRAGLAVCK